MSAKIAFRLAAYSAAALLMAACIYPYTVDIRKGDEYPLVVEGDLHIGGTSVVKLSHVRPFDTAEYEDIAVFAQGYIEGEDGKRVQGVDADVDTYLSSSSYYDYSTSLVFDTSKLPENQRYRLHLDTFTAEGSLNNQFESDWIMPCPAPTIDALTYSKNDHFKELWVGLSMHCHGSHYFRWTFDETWEYHSDIQSYIEYVPRSWNEYEMKETGGYYQHIMPTYYYCWKSASSSQINIFTTKNQTEDCFEELAFHTIPLSDKRLQVMYRINVQLEAMSEDAYNYWYNMQQNSEGQGSIFSPVPSEMASNVHCISDPSVQVMGYLNAAVPTSAVMFYNNEDEGFYRQGPLSERRDSTISAYDISLADQMFSTGFLPYMEIYTMGPTPSDYTWNYATCIDCRKQGGTKTRPEGWPSGHI